MLLRPGFSLLVFALIPAAGWSADAPSPASPTIWHLDETAQLGGHAATVLGTPKVINEAGGKAVYFDGVGDGLLLPVNPLEGLAKFTIEVLIRPERDGAEAQRFLHIQDGQDNRALMEIRLKDGYWALDTFLRSDKTSERSTLLDPTKRHPAGTWTWVALVYANGHMTHFINGVKELEGNITLSPMGPGQISLGMRLNKIYWFKGSIREVRFHPVALAPEELQRAEAK